jgi:hypothetical protein
VERFRDLPAVLHTKPPPIQQDGRLAWLQPCSGRSREAWSDRVVPRTARTWPVGATRASTPSTGRSRRHTPTRTPGPVESMKPTFSRFTTRLLRPEAHQGDVPTSRTDTQNVFLCRRCWAASACSATTNFHIQPRGAASSWPCQPGGLDMSRELPSPAERAPQP